MPSLQAAKTSTQFLLSRALVSGMIEYILKLETVSFAKVIYNNFFLLSLIAGELLIET